VPQLTAHAAPELRIDWEPGGMRHCNRRYFGKVNFWRDILPGTLGLQLQDSHGEWL